MQESQSPKNLKILIVEDDEDVAVLIDHHLRKAGYAPVLIADGQQAIEWLESETCALVLLDWMLPGLSGVEILKRFRTKQGKSELWTPVIMLTAKASPEDIVQGLDSGADDYLPKPFEMSVLMARVQAQMRRSQINLKSGTPRGSSLSSGPISDENGSWGYGPFLIHPKSYTVTLGGAALELTRYEYDLICVLCSDPARVWTRKQLIEKVRGQDVAVTDRAIDTQMVALRKKLGKFSDWIETIRGIGYRLRSE